VFAVRYFFDTYDDDTIIKDDVGLECASLDVVRDQAAVSLAELARDKLPGSLRRLFAIKAHDGHRHVLEATLAFEAVLLTQ
jgi:hypothetical protein